MKALIIDDNMYTWRILNPQQMKPNFPSSLTEAFGFDDESQKTFRFELSIAHYLGFGHRHLRKLLAVAVYGSFGRQ